MGPANLAVTFLASGLRYHGDLDSFSSFPRSAWERTLRTLGVRSGSDAERRRLVFPGGAWEQEPSPIHQVIPAELLSLRSGLWPTSPALRAQSGARARE